MKDLFKEIFQGNEFIIGLATGFLIWFAYLNIAELNTNSEVQALTNHVKLVQHQLANCQGVDCMNIGLDFNAWINHPDNQEVVAQCEKDAECYEAFQDFIKWSLNNLFNQIG